MGSSSAIVIEAIEEFMSVESIFDDQLLDDVVRNLAKANTEDLDVVIDLNLAHQQLLPRSKIISSLLRQTENFSERFGGESLPEELMESITKITTLKDKIYGDVLLDASAIIEGAKVAPFESRVEELKQKLSAGVDLVELSQDVTLSAGVDLLTSLFADDDETVRKAAIEVYVRRVYRAFIITDLDVQDSDGRTTCSFTYRFSDVTEAESVSRSGMLSVVEGISSLDAVLVDFEAKFGKSDKSLNSVHLAIVGESPELADLETAILGSADKMTSLGIRTANTVIPVEKK